MYSKKYLNIGKQTAIIILIINLKKKLTLVFHAIYIL